MQIHLLYTFSYNTVIIATGVTDFLCLRFKTCDESGYLKPE